MKLIRLILNFAKNCWVFSGYLDCIVRKPQNISLDRIEELQRSSFRGSLIDSLSVRALEEKKNVNWKEKVLLINPRKNPGFNFFWRVIISGLVITLKITFIVIFKGGGLLWLVILDSAQCLSEWSNFMNKINFTWLPAPGESFSTGLHFILKFHLSYFHTILSLV